MKRKSRQIQRKSDGLPCTYCSNTYRDRKSLGRHIGFHLQLNIRRHDIPVEPPLMDVGNNYFRCSQCPKQFSYEEILEKHNKIHQSKRLKKSVSPISDTSVPNVEKPDESLVANMLLNRHCPVCPKKFMHALSLKNHMKIHAAENASELAKGYACDRCDKKFLFAVALDKHYDRAHGEASLENIETEPNHTNFSFKNQREDFADRKYFVPNKSREPAKIVDNALEAKECKQCGKKFMFAVALAHHISKIHGGEKNYEKTGIMEEVDKKEGFYRYFSHQPIKDDSMEVEETKVESEQLLFTEKINTSRCPFCFLTEFSSDQHYIHHMNVCSNSRTRSRGKGVEERTFSNINKGFGKEDRENKVSRSKDLSKNTNEVIKHQRKLSSKDIFHCTLCEKKIKSRKNFHRHLLKHSDRKIFQCNRCPRQFLHEINYKVHIKVHTKHGLYHCWTCRKTFPRRNHYVNHMVTHQSKKFKCDVCQKKYNWKNSLRLHMFSHFKSKTRKDLGLDKVYRCKDCDRVYERERDLLLHTPTHSGKKSHVCEQCGRAFFRLSSLTRHVNRHLRSHTCRNCKHAFDRRSSLVKHQERCIEQNSD